MRITKLILKSYIRFQSNNIKEFIFTPKSHSQIILGRNGSGKSSLLDELSPLPAVAADFNRGGMKAIELEHRGSEYVLTSTFTSSAKHSFIKDGEELNPGGTASVQKELVRQHFAYTQDIHDLLTGRVRFTEMTPARRREWITSLSDTDLTYAIKTYNQARSKARDFQGALKHVRGRMANETNKLMAIEDAAILEEMAGRIRDELTALMGERVPGLESFNTLKSTLQGKLQQLEQASRSILTTDLQMPGGYSFTGPEDLNDQINELRASRTATETLLQNAIDEHEELERLLETIRDFSAGSVEELEEKLTKAKADMEAKLASVRLFKIENPEEKVNDTIEAIPLLIEILQSIQDNGDGLYSRESYQHAQHERRALMEEADKINRQLRRIEHRVEHIKEAKETQCPQCNFVWREGMAEGELERLQEQLKRGEALLSKNLKITASKEDYIAGCELWISYHQRFQKLMNDYPRLQMLWDHVLREEFLIRNPSSHIPKLAIWEQDLDNARSRAELTKVIERLTTALESAKDGADSKHLSEQFSRLETRIGALTEELSRINRELKTLEDYQGRISRVLEIDLEAVELANEIISMREKLVQVYRNEKIDEVIAEHQNVLAGLQHRLNSKNSLEAIIGDLKLSEKELERDYESMKLIVDALSPNDGLIAEQLAGLIGNLVEQMSEIISHIWTYDLHVLPCGIESGDLDYRFPLQVRSPDNIVSDIGRASDGQREVIDFAFKLVAMIYLEMGDYPLYLDEVGRTCDEQHRVNLVNYIKMLMEARRHSQLYYISHFASQHGAMSGADITVIDGANIAVPSRANEHVTFK